MIVYIVHDFAVEKIYLCSKCHLLGQLAWEARDSLPKWLTHMANQLALLLLHGGWVLKGSFPRSRR